MYIFKQPGIGGEVGMHQDGAFLYTVPQTCLGYWWALHDCSKENGCLWAIPGSHKWGMNRRFRRKDLPEYGTEFVPPEPILWSTDGEQPIECPAGSLVLIHHSVVHYSAANTSSHARHAYSIHLVDGKEGVVYPQDNWLQRSDHKNFNEVPYV
jgi:phytanoyl-CoA hydroxylase